MEVKVITNKELNLCGLLLPNDPRIVQYMTEIVFPVESSFLLRPHFILPTGEMMIEFLYLSISDENLSYAFDRSRMINKIFNLVKFPADQISNDDQKAIDYLKSIEPDLKKCIDSFFNKVNK